MESNGLAKNKILEYNYNKIINLFYGEKFIKIK